MRTLKQILGLTAATLLFTNSSPISACTDFRIAAKDGTILITRSMEFAEDLKTNVRTSIQGREFKTTAPDGKPGLSWKAKYGYVYLDGMGVDAPFDGMNEVGLSYEALYFPGFADYQTVPTGKEDQALPYMNFGDWVLGNFKTVEEVRNALSSVYVCGVKIPSIGNIILPAHFSLFDASGKGIVVEYVHGKLNVYDNLGVFTNSPEYPWHLTNLDNYIHLTPTNPSPIVAKGITFVATGQGFGMIGLPGDISPPSRFVKTAILLHVAIPVDDAAGAVNLAEHVINNVDIPLGLAREPGNGTATNDLTQWVVFKDLTHKILYYRTYENMALRSIALERLNFKENAARVKMPLYSKAQAQDMTDALLKSTN